MVMPATASRTEFAHQTPPSHPLPRVAVAEQLQNPVAQLQGLSAALATPGVAPPSAAAAATPATAAAAKFEFAEDVAALLQALEGRTPATALRQRPALGRAAAVATTVQRRAPAERRPSLGARGGGEHLLDLEG